MASRQIFLMSRPKHRLRVALLDDHPIIAVGVSAYLREHADFEVLSDAHTVDQLFAALKEQECDAALVDFYMPDDRLDGVAFIKRLRLHAPALSIIVLSSSKSLDTELVCHRAGANAFLEKATSLSLIADMVRMTVSEPQKFFVVRGGVLQAIIPQAPEDLLSTAEIEILRHIADGLSVTQVAEKLQRSKKTVSTHKRSAMRKLGLADDLGLALFLKEKFKY